MTRNAAGVGILVVVFVGVLGTIWIIGGPLAACFFGSAIVVAFLICLALTLLGDST